MIDRHRTLRRSLAATLLALATLPACRPSSRDLVDVPAPDPAGLPARSASRLEALLTESHARTAAATPRQELDANAFLTLGHGCLARGFSPCSLAAYRNATVLAPDDPEAWLFEAQALTTGGRPTEAAAAIRTALSLEAGDLIARFRLAEALGEADQEPAARVELAKILASPTLEPQLEAAARVLAGRLQLEHDAQAALTHLDRALELAPAALIAEHSRADALRRLGREAEAQAAAARANNVPVPLDDPRARVVALERVHAAFDALIDLAETSEGTDPNVLLGFADAQFGGLDGAAAEFERHLAAAGSLAPEAQARLLWVQGALQERLGRHLEARGRFSQAAELDPTLTPARTRLAAAHFHLGDAEAALGVLAEVVASGQDTVAALDLRSQIWLASRRPAQAEQDLRRALELDPRNGALRLRLAELAERTGRTAEAIELYSGAIELTSSDRDRALALFRVARLRAATGDLAAVESDLRRAIAMDPTQLDPQLALGGLLLNTERIDEALVVWRRAGLTAPGSPVPRRAEAAGLLVAQRWEEASRRLEESLAVFPDDPALVATLARHLAACPDLARREPVRALQLARRAVELEPSPPNRETFAMALAENGDFGGAAAEQQRLLDDLGTRAGTRLATLKANLARYQQQQRCCAAGVS